jgi:peroxiredoxin
MKQHSTWASSRWSAVLASAAVAACTLAAASPARADATADSLLAKVRAAYGSAQSLSASLSVTTGQGLAKTTEIGNFRLRKPNLARLQITSPQKMSVMADGKGVYILLPDNQYLKRSLDQGLMQTELIGGLASSLFFGHDAYGVAKLSDVGLVKTYSGKQAVGGVNYDMVTVSGKTPVDHTVKIFIAPDGLVGRTVTSITVRNTTAVRTHEWKSQKLNAVPASASFAVALPRSAKLYSSPHDDDLESRLVAVGKPAPAFAFPTPDGGTVSLAASAAAHKAVLVNFWFVNCPTCREEFPHLQKLYSERKDKGLELIAINHGDDKEAIEKYLSENKLTFEVGMPPEESDIFRDYGVQAYPTTYIIDSKGTVVFRSVGYDEEGIHKALEKLGVK